MSEGVSDRPVDGQFRADAHANHHEANLVDFAVAEDTTQVVLNDGVENRKARHDRTDINQQFRPGKAAGQRIHRHFGGKGAEENGPGGSGFRIRIRQPVVQKWNCLLYTSVAADE